MIVLCLFQYLRIGFITNKEIVQVNSIIIQNANDDKHIEIDVSEKNDKNGQEALITDEKVITVEE